MPEGSRVAEAPLPSPRKEGGLLKRSLTMSAGAVNIAPLLSQMNQKFIKSILDLPVASDIPRMVSRTTVTSIAKSEDGEGSAAGGLIFNRSEGTVGQPKPENAIALSKSFITLLFQAYNADNKRLLTLANEKFDEILPIDFEGDTRDRFNQYLEAIVMSELTVSAILKCINQGIAAPAIMALRMGLMGKLNYKDCGNNWNIEVQTNTNSAIVTHEKREMTVPPGCEFVWRLEMHLAAPFSQLMHVEFSITEVHFTDDNMDMDRKVKIIEALSAFFSNDLRDKYSTLSPSKIGLRPPNSARAEGPTATSSTVNGSLAPPQLTLVSAPVLELPSSSAASSSASKRLGPKDAR